MLSIQQQCFRLWQTDLGQQFHGAAPPLLLGQCGVQHHRLVDLLADPAVNHFGVAPEEIPSVALQSQPGDALFFSHQLWHASFGGRVGRRMFTLNFVLE